MNARTRRAFPATCFCALVLVFCLGGSVASAKVVHEEVGSFKVEGNPVDIAADRSGGPSNGDAYTAMFPASIVKFSGTGEPLATITGTETPAGSFGFFDSNTFTFSGIAVDSSGSVNKGDLYVADIEHGVVDKFDDTGKFVCQITAKAPVSSEEQKDECNGAAGSATNVGGFEPIAAVVDAAGDLFVADAAHNAVDEFGSKGEFIEEITGPDITNPTKLAVAPSGALYIVNGGNIFSGGVDVVKDSGGAFTVVDSSEPRGVAIDPATGALYAQDNSAEGAGVGRIDEYEPSGLLESTFISKANGENHNVSTLAVGVGGKVYGAEFGLESVSIFGPDIAVPTVTLAAATGVEETTAVFHGEVSPDTAHGGTEVTKCEFEYVTQAQFETSQFANAVMADCAPATPYASAQSVSATIGGLAPSTTYHYRLAAAGANNHVSYSEAPAEETFATPGPPTIAGETTSGVTRTGATLEAQVDPNGHDTHYEFQYGETTSYGASVPVPAVDIGEGQAPVAVGQQIAGLKIGTTYHYRVVAENSRGKTSGTDHTVTTVPVAGVESQLVLAGPHTAMIKARIDPRMGLPSLNGATTCVLQYVAEAEFAASGFAGASSVPCTPASIDSSSEGQNVIVQLSGLAVDTGYDYRFVTVNEAGEAAVGGTLATFGLAPPFEAGMFDVGGAPYTQAGGHPYELTTNIAFNSTTSGKGFSPASGSLKDVRVQLPVGLGGNPTAAAKCTVMAAKGLNGARCGPGTQVGVMHVYLENVGGHFEGHLVGHWLPLYNVVPGKGVAAEFASAEVNAGQSATIDFSVRTGEGYGLSADALNIPSIGVVRRVSVSVWGVPADPAHDSQRICPPGETGTGAIGVYEVGCGSGEPPKAFVRAPTSCPGGNLTTNVLADSYNAPGEFAEAHAEMPGTTNCAVLRFTPRISVQPESTSASSATGVRVDLHVPQEENPVGLAQADLKNVVVTLPEGVVVNPSAAGGLTGCSSAEVDLHGSGPAGCPDSSKVGSVEIDTPLLDHPVRGGVYVASPGDNPFGSLLAVYLAVDDPVSGVVLKVAGHIEADPATGRLVARFSETPQLPFEDVKVHFFGGPQAALATPPACGTFTVGTDWTPWSTPEGADAFPSASFNITSGANGTACGPQGFAPGFTAGTVSNQAGAFSPLDVSVSRQDQDQALGGVRVTTPPGVSAILKGVEHCGEPQAAQGTCPVGSLIGRASAAAGVGPAPFWVQGGQVFLTGPYKGAPFGLSIVVPAVAGPFNLGNVVVRAAVNVDPVTAQITVASDPLPTILQGIPLQVRQVNVSIDRPGFMFNPTDCEPLTVGGVLTSTQGATGNVSSRFQAANCATLQFKPVFKVSTQAATSKKQGASLVVKGSFPTGEANLHSVAVVLPKQLPARLTTIQQACLAAVFQANPASCPVGSNIGTATASTPILATPVTGPVYLVSHGGAAFPDVVMVLQGEGVTLEVTGSISIKKGITSSTFATIPDAPITTFTLTLPEGPHSGLAAVLLPKAKGSLCGTTLSMPFTVGGQNGAQTKQNVKIQVTGCPKAKKQAVKKHTQRRVLRMM